MKRLFLILLVCIPLVGAVLAAPHVTDNANLLSGRAAQLSSEIGNSPVWVETWTTIPGGSDLKTYTDQRLQSINHPRSFLIVLTTQPRAWRISMYPIGFVGSDVTKGVGDQMGVFLKSGDIYGALTKASRTLGGVASGTTTVKASPDGSIKTVTTTTSTSVATSKKIVPTVPRPATVVVQQASSDCTWLWVTVSVIIIIITIFLVCVYFDNRRAERLAQKRQQEHDERMAAIEAHNRVSMNVNPSSSRPYTPPSPSSATSEQRQQAQQSWDSYTPAQRQTVVNQYSSSPYYHGGVLSDPFSFWMFMTMVNGGFGHNQGYGYGGGGMYTPAPAPVYAAPPVYVEEERVERTTTTRTEETYTPLPSSYSSPAVEDDSRRSSDDSGSSSSWSDSGGSSSSSSDSSSSSSSDSGGSGGDW